MIKCNSSTSSSSSSSEKETGQEFAAKIIDLSDSSDEGVYEATKREIEVLRMVAGHPYISESRVEPHYFNILKANHIYFLDILYLVVTLGYLDVFL